MNVRVLVARLEALDTPDAEVFASSSPYPEENYWPITELIYCSTVVELTGENNG